MTDRDRTKAGLDEAKAAQQTSVSAYDLLPIEDREAVEWVREHGGIEAVKKRLMPEGMEWPRFEDGRQVKFRDEGVDVHGETRSVEGVKFSQNGFVFISDGMGVTWWANDRGPIEEAEVDPGKRVKRPAPKVLDADGLEIRVGDVLYRKSDCHTVKVVEVDEKTFTDADDYVRPGEGYTHRAPVLAADDKPLREGETVYHVADGKAYVVHNLCEHYAVVKPEGADRFADCRFEYLTHERLDSWERLEQDATLPPYDYCDRHGLLGEDIPTAENFARDLVRRARALAERGWYRPKFCAHCGAKAAGR